jgi:serine/threonine protein kinase
MVDVPRSGPSDSPTIVDAGASPQAKRSQGSFADQPFLPQGMILSQRYEILQILGEGGMGAVYKAKDRELNRMVALKPMIDAVSRDC